jgi:hypothetical protein
MNPRPHLHMDLLTDEANSSIDEEPYRMTSVQDCLDIHDEVAYPRQAIRRDAQISPSARQAPSAPEAKALFALMDQWPHSWAGVTEDVPVGAGLVAELRPFVMRLRELDLSPKTVRHHLNNLWVIGGEIIRELNYEPNLRKEGPRQLLLQTVAAGCAPLVRDATEDEQRSFDATARRLLRFLTDERPK